MQVVLIRHAHKGVQPISDPELSVAGFMQADKLAQNVQSGALIRPTHAWCSEKIRTQQTLSPVCRYTKTQIETTSQLNVRGVHESVDSFRGRIKTFLTLMDDFSNTHESKDQVHFVCTHFDWIEESMAYINSDRDLLTHEFASWAPGQFLHFQIDKHIWQIVKKGVIA